MDKLINEHTVPLTFVDAPPMSVTHFGCSTPVTPSTMVINLWWKFRFAKFNALLNMWHARAGSAYVFDLNDHDTGLLLGGKALWNSLGLDSSAIMLEKKVANITLTKRQKLPFQLEICPTSTKTLVKLTIPSSLLLVDIGYSLVDTSHTTSDTSTFDNSNKHIEIMSQGNFATSSDSLTNYNIINPLRGQSHLSSHLMSNDKDKKPSSLNLFECDLLSSHSVNDSDGASGGDGHNDCDALHPSHAQVSGDVLCPSAKLEREGGSHK